MNPSLFSAARPIDSIVRFTNRHLVLSEDKKRTFIADLEDFLSTYAFQDKKVDFDQAFTERFIKYDLPNLFEVLTQLKIAEKTGRFLQITANLSKIAQSAFLPREAPHCYQVKVINTDIWGWIPKNYVDHSQELKKHFDESTKTLVFEDFSPSVLFGIQRLSLTDESTKEIDLSIEVFIEMCKFALKMQCTPFLVDLMVFLSSIVKNEEVQKELEIHEASFNSTFEEIAKIVEPYKADIDKRASERPFIRHDEECEGSNWFAPSHSVRSIIKFTGRCNSLSIEEQNRFFSAVRHFFTISAYNNHTMEIPPYLRNRFVKVDIPFLLKAMQFVSEYEKKRVLTCIQLVTRLQFSDNTLVATNRYGDEKIPQDERIGWMRGSLPSASSSDGVTPYSEVSIRSEEFFDFSALVTGKALFSTSTEELFQLLRHAIEESNTSIRDSVVQRMSKFCSDPKHKQEVVDTFIAHIDNEELLKVAIELDLQPLIPSDPSSLSEAQLYTLCMFNRNHARSFIEMLESCLKGSSHYFAVLNQLLENVEEGKQTRIREHCYQKALELIPVARRKYNETPQREMLTNVIDILKGSREHTLEEVERWVKHYTSLRDLKNEDIPRIFDAISSDQAASYWRIAGHEELINRIRDALILFHPALLEKTLTPECMETFFPDLAGKENPVEKLIRFLFSEAPRFEEKRYDQWKAFAKSHPMSDAEIIRYYEIIDGAAFKAWFKERAPQLKYFNFYYPFYQSYKIRDLEAPFALLEKFKEENPEKEGAYQLLRTLFLKSDNVAEPEFLISCVQKTENISEKALALMQFFLCHSDIFEQSKKLQETGPQILEVIRLLTTYDGHLAKFTELLTDIPLKEANLSFIRNFFTSMYLLRKELTWHEVNASESVNRFLPSVDFKTVAFILNRDSFKEFLNSIFPEMHALCFTSLCNREKSLPHVSAIRQLIEQIKENGWLTGKNKIAFVSEVLESLVSREKDENRLKSLANNINWKSLDAIDIQAIRQLFQKEEVIALLTTDKLKEAGEFIVKNLRPPAASSSRSSSKPDEGCTIS